MDLKTKITQSLNISEDKVLLNSLEFSYLDSQKIIEIKPRNLKELIESMDI
jgi:hypothetical protein